MDAVRASTLEAPVAALTPHEDPTPVERAAVDGIAAGFPPETPHHPEGVAVNAEDWNARYPIGTRVMAYPSVRPEDPLAIGYQERAEAGRLFGDRDTDPCRRLDTFTRSVAWKLGHGAPVVLVEGYTGGIALTHVDPLMGSAA